MFKTIFLFVIIFECCFSLCKDDNNMDIDWYYGLKLHKSKDNENIFIKKGAAYFMISSAQQTKHWTFSARQINNSDSMIANTMACIYNGKCDFYITYNDQEFNKSIPITKAHAKGAFACDGDNCFHLIHSVPKLGTSENYTYPKGGLKEGQSIMCTSYNRKQLNQICQCYYSSNINVYNSKFSEKSLMPYCNKIANSEYLKTPPYSRDTTVLTVNGTKIRYLCKGRKYNDSIYDKDAIEALQCNLLTQTWLNTASKQSTNCTGAFKIYNIANMHTETPNLKWVTQNDHSKWAICEKKNWICVGDMNRDLSQNKRGGGLACMENSDVWNSYKSIITDLEPCSNAEKYYEVTLL